MKKVARPLEPDELVQAYKLWTNGLDTQQIADVMRLNNKRAVIEASVYNGLCRMREATSKRVH